MSGWTCPRCYQEILDTRQASGIGVYRAASPTDESTTARRCSACKVLFLQPPAAARVDGTLVEGLLRSPLEHGRERLVRVSCPAPGCFATLDRVTLAWATFFAQIEACPRCGVVIVDESELDAIAAAGRAYEKRVHRIDDGF